MPTADARFRRAERLILEAPASPAGAVSARLLDRVGNALPIPVKTAIREDADGSRWSRIELILAPQAHGDYIIESTDGPERLLTEARFQCQLARTDRIFARQTRHHLLLKGQGERLAIWSSAPGAEQSPFRPLGSAPFRSSLFSCR